MTHDNPFDAPRAATTAPLAAGNSMRYLQGMRPWQSFLAVVGFVASGLMIAGGGLLCAVNLSSGGSAAIALGVVYPVMGAIYLFPSLYLWRSARALRQATLDDELAEAHVETSLANQQKFWNFVGILTAILLGIYAVVLLVLLVVGLAGMA